VRILPKSAKAGEESAVVDLITVYAPALKIPDYTNKQPSLKATRVSFNKVQLVVLVSMLKEPVEYDVRVTVVEDKCASVPDISIPIKREQ
jgi:hypothetical protein